MTEVNENPEPSEDFGTSEKPEDTSQTEQEVNAEELAGSSLTGEDFVNKEQQPQLITKFAYFGQPVIWGR